MARMNPLFHRLVPLLLLAACSVQPPLPPASAPAPTVEAWYAHAARQGQKIYTIDSAASLITVTVRRGGALARFGHDHVVASRSVTGMVAPDAGRADFQFRLDQMSVDEPALRAAAGLDTQPSADAIEGTRTNMLGRVLEADRYPLVTLRAERVPGNAALLRLTITLHGVEKSMEVPVVIDSTPSSLTASGVLQLRQTDFGITPMSVMGGAMIVHDTMELGFRIVANAPG
jgi:hypothetical protein